MTLCTLITCWLCGNESTNTVPYKLLKATEIKETKERYKLTKMRMLMLGVQRAAEREWVWQDLTQRGSWDVGRTVRLYESINHYFRYPAKISQHRDKQISWMTVYFLYEQNKKVFAVDL